MSIIGIDTGGTFTDVARIDAAGRIERRKVLSTPADPAEAVLRGLAGLGGAEDRVVHGTTVATNALLERRLARTALVTNAGFEDLVEIGRQARPDLYALTPERPPPLVPRALRFGIAARMLADGTEAARESDEEMAALERALRDAQVEAIAVCLLHSYRDPAAERRVAARLGALGLPVVASAALLPEIREVERFSTAIANAALRPVMEHYLARIERESGRRVLVMRSDGGVLPAAAIAREPVRTLLSGPAGGVLGAAEAARRAGIEAYISFDVGGTSTDVALSGAAVRPVGDVGGVPVAVPALDIVSIGAGGGSIAWRDAGGALRVGPRSAGADPGPACYGKGTEPTITDAAIVLGRLEPRFFLGGAMAIDPDRSARAIEALAAALGVAADAAAAGVIEVALAATERALRRVSIERGEDPRERALLAFGGAGGLLGAPLAERIGIARVLVPRDPGLLSAVGMARAPLLFDRAATILRPLDALAGGDLDRAFQALEVAVLDAARESGAGGGALRIVREVDARYEGQGYEIRIPYRAGRVAEDFHDAHERRNNFRDERRAIEVVAARVSAIAPAPAPSAAVNAPAPAARTAPAAIGRTRAGMLYRREEMEPGGELAGPAVIGEFSGTTFVPAGWRARVLAAGDLLLAREGGS